MKNYLLILNISVTSILLFGCSTPYQTRTSTPKHKKIYIPKHKMQFEYGAKANIKNSYGIKECFVELSIRNKNDFVTKIDRSYQVFFYDKENNQIHNENVTFTAILEPNKKATETIPLIDNTVCQKYKTYKFIDDE